MASLKYDRTHSVLRLLRFITNSRLIDVKHEDGTKISALTHYERDYCQPSEYSIEGIAKSYNIEPDIIYYCFGMMPPRHKKIIKSDPFYYMNKLNELFKEHNMRYDGARVDLPKLNFNRCIEYVGKSRSETRTKKRRTKK